MSRQWVEVIKQAPSPTNLSELRSFLGMLNFYAKHLPNHSTVLAPLHKLLHKDIQWRWGDKENKTFEEAKEMLQADSLLVHFDPTKPLVVSCDSSPYGVGCVLSHQMADGSERPVSYSSRTLSSAEKTIVS